MSGSRYDAGDVCDAGFATVAFILSWLMVPIGVISFATVWYLATRMVYAVGDHVGKKGNTFKRCPDAA